MSGQNRTDRSPPMPVGPTLEYKRPETPMLRGGRTWRAVILRDRVFATKVAGFIAGGVGLTFFWPLALAIVAFPLLLRFQAIDIFDWWPLYWWCFAIGMAIVYCIEWRTRGRFLSEELDAQGFSKEDFSAGMLRTSSYGEYQLRTNAVAMAMWIEILLSAPRLLIYGLALWRQSLAYRNVGTLRAVEIIEGLLGEEQGLPVNWLVTDGETTERLLATLKYLAFHDWVGLSKSADRVWLSSEARRRLADSPAH